MSSVSIKVGGIEGTQVHVWCVAPPLWHGDVVVRQGEEDDETADGNARVHGSRENEGIVAPPLEVPLLHDVVDDET